MKRMVKQDKIDVMENMKVDDNAVEMLKGLKLTEGLKPIKRLPFTPSWLSDEGYLDILFEYYNDDYDRFIALAQLYNSDENNVEDLMLVSYSLIDGEIVDINIISQTCNGAFFQGLTRYILEFDETKTRYASHDINLLFSDYVLSIGSRIGTMTQTSEEGITQPIATGCEFHFHTNNYKYGYGFCIGDSGFSFDYGPQELGSNLTAMTICNQGVYLNEDLKINRYIHNIFISGLARNKNINVSFQVYSKTEYAINTIENLVKAIGQNSKIAVNGYHDDLGVIIAGVSVNSNNELSFVGVNSSATSIAWNEISDVTITDSIQQL